MQAAHLAAIWEPQVKRFYQKKQANSHIMVAKKAVAGKLARAIYHMLNKHDSKDLGTPLWGVEEVERRRNTYRT